MSSNSHDQGLSELDLRSAVRSDFGWIGDRAHFPDETRKAILELLAGNFEQDQLEPFMGSLDRAFGGAIEIMEHHLKRQKASGDVPPQKLGTEAREFLKKWLKHLRRARNARSDLLLEEIIPAIRVNEPLAELITVELEYQRKFRVLDPLKTPDREVVERLPRILTDLEHQIASGIARGSIDPGHEFLATCYVESFHVATGRLPSITWNADIGEHSGYSLAILRLMAIALNETQDTIERRAMPVDMVTPFRKAIEKKKSEING